MVMDFDVIEIIGYICQVVITNGSLHDAGHGVSDIPTFALRNALKKKRSTRAVLDVEVYVGYQSPCS
jgi:hypothetical protein